MLYTLLLSKMATLVFLLGFLLASFDMTGAESVGICYGMMGNNLPQHQEVINLYKSHSINRMRLYDPNHGALNALRGSNIQVMLGLPNSDLQSIASSHSNAVDWVQINVVNFWPDVKIRYIAVGNEISPINGGTAWMAQYVHPALTNIQSAISSFGLQHQIKVSTSIDLTLIGNSFPPSQGAFRDDVRAYLDPIVGFLVSIGAPLLANVYPYFSYSGNPRDISLPYALFNAPGVVVWDGQNGYQNLFDAMLDAVYAALEKSGGPSVEVVVSESGWPSGGGFGTSVENSRSFYTNLIQHVRGGTPKRPNKPIETYLFAMFDENNKEPEFEKHFGVFFPSKQQKFPLNFAAEGISEGFADNNTSISLRSEI